MPPIDPWDDPPELNDECDDPPEEYPDDPDKNPDGTTQALASPIVTAKSFIFILFFNFSFFTKCVRSEGSEPVFICQTDAYDLCLRYLTF